MPCRWGRPLMHFDLDTCFNLWHLIEKQHLSTWHFNFTSALPFLLYIPPCQQVYRGQWLAYPAFKFVPDQQKPEKPLEKRLLHSLIACNVIINAYFKHGMLFRYFIGCQLNLFSVGFHSQTMTGNDQHAETTWNHLLNSTIPPDGKHFSGYDPKRFMSEQHSIGSKRHPHLYRHHDNVIKTEISLVYLKDLLCSTMWQTNCQVYVTIFSWLWDTQQCRRFKISVGNFKMSAIKKMN